MIKMFLLFISVTIGTTDCSADASICAAAITNSECRSDKCECASAHYYKSADKTCNAGKFMQ